eukprot:10451427-Prorocentrum_lima.AAC.1
MWEEVERDDFAECAVFATVLRRCSRFLKPGCGWQRGELQAAPYLLSPRQGQTSEHSCVWFPCWLPRTSSDGHRYAA